MLFTSYLHRKQIKKQLSSAERAGREVLIYLRQNKSGSDVIGPSSVWRVMSDRAVIGDMGDLPMVSFTFNQIERVVTK